MQILMQKKLNSDNPNHLTTNNQYKFKKQDIIYIHYITSTDFWGLV